jgi:hypothetical protein
MAKSKLAPARLYPQGSPTKYHPVSIAISQAQAAAWLLEQLHHGDLACHLGVGPIKIAPDPSMPLPQAELHDWLTGMAADMLRDALALAQEEFNRHHAAGEKVEVA